MATISTHDLTKRSTRKNRFNIGSRGISTHDLTKRSTCRTTTSFTKLLTFQLTTSRRGRQAVQQSFNKTIIFQLTTSRRGRPLTNLLQSLNTTISTHDLTKRSTMACNLYNNDGYISTHDLTKRSTFKINQLIGDDTFQLTTSRRGRLQITINKNVSLYFNSRPHEEVDVLVPLSM